MSFLNLGRHDGPERHCYDADADPCGGQLSIVDQSGPVWTVVCERCGYEEGLPARNADPALRRRMREASAGFPGRYARRLDETAENRPALEAIRSWMAGYGDSPVPAPAIWGEAGRGKSHLLVAACRKLIIERDVSVLFRSSARLLDEMQESFSDGAAYRSLWDRALTVDLLALDDVGAERGTEWRADRLARLVDERYERELPIVVATNYQPATWEKVMDERTRSRLRGMTFPVELQGSDRRLAAVQ